MYNFVFIFFYKISSKRNPDAKGAAKTFVALATFMHLLKLKKPPPLVVVMIL